MIHQNDKGIDLLFIVMRDNPLTLENFILFFNSTYDFMLGSDRFIYLIKLFNSGNVSDWK